MANQPTSLVTGASVGMGKDIAKTLTQSGFIVYAVAHRLESMEDLKPLGIIPLHMDITVDDDSKTVLETIKKNRGSVDILVNNAGFGLHGPVEEIPIKDARYQFEVNLFGLARLTQLIIPYMREKKAGGIINISSVGGEIYTPMGAWYHATKHALEGWSDCLRLELKSFGIDVIVVQPGLVKTEFDSVMASLIKKYSKNSPYSALMKKLSLMTQNMYKLKQAAPPSTISALVLKAAQARRPKTRYAGGGMAKTSLWGRRLLPTRLLDKILLKM